MPWKPNRFAVIFANPTLTATLIDFNQTIRFGYITSSIQAIMKSSKGRSRLNLLDIGAGLGTFSDYISAKQDCFIVNVEVSSKRRLPNMVIADGSRLPFKPEAFDFVTSSDVFENVKLEARSSFVKELLRCSKQGFVMTYSKIHTAHPSPSGIHIFERLAGYQPEWYLEHNQNIIVNDASLIDVIEKNGAKVKFIKPLAGISVLFFTGLMIFIQGRVRNKIINFLMQAASYLITRLIDPPPYYVFGLSAVKVNK
jgi:2-polyprenyl-3-methyl-5-hydroxy-6-metoxy-1,4-benzoquinol methylase